MNKAELIRCPIIVPRGFCRNSNVTKYFLKWLYSSMGLCVECSSLMGKNEDCHPRYLWYYLILQNTASLNKSL